MTRARKALELLYDGVCTVTEWRKVKKENSSTGFEEVIVYEDIPCRLSFKSVTATAPNESGAASIAQTTTLFLSPDIAITAGSKIMVTQNGETAEYAQSGKAARYATHQEIPLDLFKGWA